MDTRPGPVREEATLAWLDKYGDLDGSLTDDSTASCGYLGHSSSEGAPSEQLTLTVLITPKP
eukprot:4759317-Pyramimonas_sp.AAC.1